MKRLLIQGIVLSSLFISLIFFLEYFYSDYTTVTDAVYKPLLSRHDKITHLYIGNSHTIPIGEFTTDTQSSVLNLGYQGLDLFKEMAILKKWLPNTPKLKYVYLGLDYEIIGQNQTLSGEEYLDRQFFQYTDTLYRYNLMNSLMSRSSFFRANRDLSFLFRSKQKKQSVKNNAIPLSTHTTLNEIECKKRAKEHSEIKFKRELVNENLSYLYTIINLCKQYNVQLILFNTPKSSCFIASGNSDNIAFAKKSINSLLLETHTHYYNFFSSPFFKDEDFKDYDHLNQTGAERLITLINIERDRIK